MAKDRWVKIGVVGVDSGHLLIGDPCYLENFDLGKATILPRGKMADQVLLHFHAGFEGETVRFESGLGDGGYTVWARTGRVKGWDGERIKEVRVKFC